MQFELILNTYGQTVYVIFEADHCLRLGYHWNVYDILCLGNSLLDDSHATLSCCQID